MLLGSSSWLLIYCISLFLFMYYLLLTSSFLHIFTDLLQSSLFRELSSTLRKPWYFNIVPSYFSEPSLSSLSPYFTLAGSPGPGFLLSGKHGLLSEWWTSWRSVSAPVPAAPLWLWWSRGFSSTWPEPERKGQYKHFTWGKNTETLK